MALPDEFWVQPTACFPSPDVQALYSHVSDSMREELEERDAGIIDYMLGERLCFLYAHVRQKDRNSTDGATAAQQRTWDNDKARRETLMTLVSLGENVQKRWLKADQINADDTIKRKLLKALDDSLMDIDPTVAKSLRVSLADNLEKANI